MTKEERELLSEFRSYAEGLKGEIGWGSITSVLALIDRLAAIEEKAEYVADKTQGRSTTNDYELVPLVRMKALRAALSPTQEKPSPPWTDASGRFKP